MKHTLIKIKENGFSGTATYKCDRCKKVVYASIGSIPFQEKEKCGDKKVDKVIK